MSNSNRVAGPDRREAAAPPEQPITGGARRVLLIAGVVAIASIVLFVLIWYNGPSGGTAPSGKSYGKVPARVVDLSSAPAHTVTTGATVTAAGSVAAPGLVIGQPTATVKVVVYDDFGSAQSRAFEDATRDFLQDAAAKGTVEVEYVPVAASGQQYSTDALNAFHGALTSSTPTAALNFRDLLFDNQPATSAASEPTAANFGTWATTVNADGKGITSAVSTGTPAFAHAMTTLATKAGATGMPTVFVDGKPFTGSSIAAEADKLETMVSGS